MASEAEIDLLSSCELSGVAFKDLKIQKITNSTLSLMEIGLFEVF